MKTSEERVREIIAEQAGDWFVAHRAGSLDAAESRAFEAWLTASPLHVEEYLGVAQIARHLPAAAADPDMPLEAILDRIRTAEAGSVEELAPSSKLPVATQRRPLIAPRWRFAAVGATLALIAGTFLWWYGDRAAVPVLYATRHGELKTVRLADNSLLRLNTDTRLTVRYSRALRLVELDHGQAFFEVVHESGRPFWVIAWAAAVTAVGTQFDVYRQSASTLVTVALGQVRVTTAPAATSAGSRASLRVSAGEQVRVSAGELPAIATPADITSYTAWLHRQMVFEQEPLAAVAAEFNRYSALPIDIETPTLRTLLISGVFATDDPETFIAFLRTLDGVSVETTPTRIRVLARTPSATPVKPPRAR
jgi:transmembrane sensor